MKVLICVTHLLGAGHLSRSLTLGRAFAVAGHEVVVMSGGRPAPHLDDSGVELVQLPPVASDGTNFSRLLDASGNEADADLFGLRRQRMLDTLGRFGPDVLITELFPFGRRSLSEEFLALLQAAQVLPNRPVILCSIRDILAPPSKPAKADKARSLLTRHYDGVLVHSDPNITQLADSWPVTPELEPMLHYTGYVAPPVPAPPADDAGKGEVIVSAGGGSVGQMLFENAIEAARLDDRHWRLLVGGDDRARRIAALRERAGTLEISIEPVRPDFRRMLQQAAASVSMCGYNTVLDILQSGVPALLVPFDDDGEVEQSLRAHSLSDQPAISVLASQEMTPARLLERLAPVIAGGRRPEAGLMLDGGAGSVRIAESLLERHR